MNLEKIKEFVIVKHQGQTRKQGTPFYLHPFAVATILKDKGYDLSYQAAALCHDLLEETDASYEDITAVTNKNVADVVKLLTKETGYNNEDYLNGIKANEIALVVKLADRLHNLSEVEKTTDDFIQRYINESKEYYIPLAKNTLFEAELKALLDALIIKYN